jgi:serine protease Do
MILPKRSVNETFKLPGFTRPFIVRIKITAMLALLSTSLWIPYVAYSQEVTDSQKVADPAPGIAHARELSSAFEAVAKQITPSVVNISAIKKPAPSSRGKNERDQFFEQFKDFFGDDFAERFGPFRGPGGGGDDGGRSGLGTGVIVDKAGYILTNNHVVGEADELKVRLSDEREVKAELIGRDPRTDLAVIKIKADKLVAAKLGDSDELKIGEWVIAAGNPFGLDNTITAGIVSAKGRSIMGGGQFEDFIQTDAAINPGNSGGPLVNLNGEVIGINTAIFSRSGGYMGIGFAIPASMAKTVLESLISKGKVVRGWLGVGIQNLTEDLSQSFNFAGTDGALVGHVEEEGPGGKAGLKQGDIIIRMDDLPVKNINQLRNKIAATAPGTSVTFEYLRNGRKETTSVKIGELPTQQTEAKEEETPAVDLGLAIEALTPDIARRLGTKSKTGVVVRQVEPSSLGERATLQPRDVIVSVNGNKVTSTSDFYERIQQADLKKGVRLVVESQGMERFVFLRAAE